MLLIIHILLGVASVASSIGLFLSARGRKQMLEMLHRGVLGFTSLTLLSGVGLLFSGSSIARVCGEAVLVIVLSVGAIVYERKQMEVKYEGA